MAYIRDLQRFVPFEHDKGGAVEDKFLDMSQVH